MSGARSVEQWKTFIESCLDFRPAEGVFRIARDMFTEPELFDLEMELIFERTGSTPATKANWPITTTS
jgi:anthranilate 1,2-dioxygenase (deaminating, decarboxylating) large subunit